MKDPGLFEPALRREQRVSALGRTLGLTGGGLAILAAVLVVAGQHGQSKLNSFMSGAGAGVMSALPLLFAVKTFAMYRCMDEYARQQLVEAASVAFLVTMVVSGGLIALQAVLEFSTPAWVFYSVGMGMWLAVTQVQGCRARRGRA